MEENFFDYQPMSARTILMNVIASDNLLILRVDNNGFCNAEYSGPPVTIFTLQECALNQDVLGQLSAGIGKHIDIEFDPDLNLVEIYLNYVYYPVVTSSCANILEQEASYTFEDLEQKSENLAQLYQATDEENWRLQKKYDGFLEKLQKMLAKEVDTATRKIGFFKDHKPEKAMQIAGRLEAFEEVLAFLQKQDK